MLKLNEAYTDVANEVVYFYSNQLHRTCDEKTLIKTTCHMTVPVLINFVFWVLSQAKKDNIKTLYFLARDGFIMHHIGQSLANVFFPEIECKYFYASRYAVQNDDEQHIKLLVEYMRQEGVHRDSIALVDSGWLGSMQKNIQSIRHKYFRSASIKGYYFGLLSKTNPHYGEYNAYLFSPEKNWPYSYGFNASVFECLCSTNHGMVIGYKNGNIIKPVLKQHSTTWHVDLQLCLIQHYTRVFLQRCNGADEIGLPLDTVKWLLLRFITSPTFDEARSYGSVLFAHDIGEKHLYHMAYEENNWFLKHNLPIAHFFNRLFRRRTAPPIHWIEGTATLSNTNTSLLLQLQLRLLYLYKYYR